MNMETLGAFPDEELDFSRMFSTQDQLDTIPHLLTQCSFPLENDGGFQFTIPSAFSSNLEANLNMAGVHESLFSSWNTLNNPDLNLFSQENSSRSNCGSSVLISSSPHETYFFSDSNQLQSSNDDSMSMDFYIMDEKNSGSLVPVFPEFTMSEAVCTNENMRSPKMGNLDGIQPGANAVPAKGLQKKRMFDFQNLVPNGTKVDISTMLEEAVHYVKFLQLQIKLLSSDDLWMYAPIAYNGMDISKLI